MSLAPLRLPGHHRAGPSSWRRAAPAAGVIGGFALSLLLVGCQDSGGSSDTSRSTASATSATSATSPTAPVLQPGRPGEPNTSLTGALAAPKPTGPPDPDDVAFMQAMIGHHAQALQMVAVGRTLLVDGQVKAIASRIEDTQRPEIAAMAQWLTAKGQRVPPQASNPGFGAGGHDQEHEQMPGMATAQQLADLAAARGADADRLFLRLMIAHHRGAVTMVVQQHKMGMDERVGELGDDIAAAQSAEITKMQAMLDRLGR